VARTSGDGKLIRLLPARPLSRITCTFTVVSEHISLVQDISARNTAQPASLSNPSNVKRCF